MNKFLIIITLLGLVVMSGCIKPAYYEITLEDGTELTCQDYAQSSGCLTLYDCNGANVTYSCVTNAKIKRVIIE